MKLVEITDAAGRKYEVNPECIAFLSDLGNGITGVTVAHASGTIQVRKPMADLSNMLVEATSSG